MTNEFYSDRKTRQRESYSAGSTSRLYSVSSKLAFSHCDYIAQRRLLDSAKILMIGPVRVTSGRHLLGDAAHPTTPNLGQARTYIDDAIVLASNAAQSDNVHTH
jgi:hypothetical protein